MFFVILAAGLVAGLCMSQHSYLTGRILPNPAGRVSNNRAGKVKGANPPRRIDREAREAGCRFNHAVPASLAPFEPALSPPDRTRAYGRRYVCSASPSATGRRSSGSGSMPFDKARKSVFRLQIAKRRTELLYGFGPPSGKTPVSVTFHGGASGSMDSPSRLRSIRTRCTCCRPDHAGGSGPDRTRTHARSLKIRTTRSAFRRRDVHVSGPRRTRIRARSSSNRNVCILSPWQYFLSPDIIPKRISGKRSGHHVPKAVSPCRTFRGGTRAAAILTPPHTLPCRHCFADTGQTSGARARRLPRSRFRFAGDFLQVAFCQLYLLELRIDVVDRHGGELFAEIGVAAFHGAALVE